jgi:hypothetical protein
VIRVLIAIGGRTDGHNLEVVGSVHTMNPVIEAQLVAQGYAEDVPVPKTETAEVTPARTAARRVAKPTPRKR